MFWSTPLTTWDAKLPIIQSQWPHFLSTGNTVHGGLSHGGENAIKVGCPTMVLAIVRHLVPLTRVPSWHCFPEMLPPFCYPELWARAQNVQDCSAQKPSSDAPSARGAQEAGSRDPKLFRSKTLGISHPPTAKDLQESRDRPATQGNPKYGSEERLGEVLLLRERAFSHQQPAHLYEDPLHTVRAGAAGVPKWFTMNCIAKMLDKMKIRCAHK